MKLIHCADLHIGSKMEAKLPKIKADERKEELRVKFSEMVAYAKQKGVSAILLSGDVFDSDRPTKKDKSFFYSVIKDNPEINFFYLLGNHDISESYTEDNLPNLKRFSSDWTYYDIGDITICGIELDDSNINSFASTLKLSPTRKNIVLLHGEITDGLTKDKINTVRLKNKNIDYLALGHIHSYSGISRLDERGFYAYSGCLEGRGFDETGKKGFILLDVNNDVYADFIPFATRTIHFLQVDISDVGDAYYAMKKVAEEVNIDKKDMIRIELIGRITFDNEGLDKTIEKSLDREGYYFVSVKDKTKRKINLQDYEGDLSLKGEFVRSVMSGDFSEDEKADIIQVGLKILSGEAVE